MTVRVASVFGSGRVIEGDVEYEVARRTGELLAGAGWTVMTGGYQGVMEAASRGAREAGGHVIGVTVLQWAATSRVNDWVAEERRAADLHDRLAQLVAADALIAVGGGIGTLAEVALSWNMLQKGHSRAPLILVGERWRRLLPVLARELAIGEAELRHVRLAEGPEAVVEWLPERAAGRG